MSPFLDLLAKIFFCQNTLDSTLVITDHNPVSIIIPKKKALTRELPNYS